MGLHGILYPHCLKKWGDASLCPPPNCTHASQDHAQTP